MKKYKRLSYIFHILAILLSDVMCAAVAYSYCDMQWGSRYACYSAPASVAFLLCVPYGFGIIICAALAWFFGQKYRKAL